MNYTTEQVEAIVIEAQEAAHEAALEFYKTALNGRDGFPCGFAWVKVYGVKGSTKLGRALKALDFDRKMWCPSKLPYQNVDLHYAGAEAAAKVLTAYGFRAYAESRWD
jgi:hypothetical protein